MFAQSYFYSSFFSTWNALYIKLLFLVHLDGKGIEYSRLS